jgi:hypothetical protein
VFASPKHGRLKIWQRKFGVRVMVNASQSFRFFERFSSYKRPALVMFMHLLAFQPWRRRLARRRQRTGRQ